ncbi:MAG: hypothetical protein KGO02_05465 [Alphaproteobacteria bacterium]|nr:hypothetical protein [Alphaproteobacteria bacterium]
MTDPQQAPIFIHSLFRSGSTWLFDRFRRSLAGYWCYQEPFHEFLINLKDRPEDVLAIHQQTSQELRHPALNKPYFYEFHAVREHIAASFAKCISFDSFFDATCCPAFADYVGKLITHAPARPVLQCCRSFGRIAFLQQQFGGAHLHLWRNPRDQWWSYQINDYFDITGLAILNAERVPEVVAQLREVVGFVPIHRDTFAEEYALLAKFPLDAEQRYLTFYVLWLYSLLENRRHGCCDLNIDRLSQDQGYCAEAATRLAALGVPGVDLGQCAVPQTQFEPSEIDYFEKIEQRARALFLAAGHAADDIAAAHEMQQAAAPAPSGSAQSGRRAAFAARQVAQQYTNRMAKGFAALYVNEGSSGTGDSGRVHDADMEVEHATLMRLEETLVRLSDERGSVSTLLEQQQHWVEKWHMGSSEAQAALTAVTAELQRLRAEAAHVRQSSEESQVLAATLRQQLDHERARSLGAASRLGELDREIGALRAELSAIAMRHKTEMTAALFEQQQVLTAAWHPQLEREREKAKSAGIQSAALQIRLEHLQSALDSAQAHEAGARSQLDTERVLRSEVEQRAGVLERQNTELRARYSAVEHAHTQVVAQLAMVRAQLAVMLTSRSWRLTAPLRWVRFQIGLLRSQGLASRLRSLFKKLARALLGRMFRWLETRPRLRRAGAALARRLGLEARLRSLYRHWWLPSMRAAGEPVAAGVTANTDLSAPRSAIEGQTPAQGAPMLSPRARQIKTWLDAARRSHLGGP